MLLLLLQPLQQIKIRFICYYPELAIAAEKGFHICRFGHDAVGRHATLENQFSRGFIFLPRKVASSLMA